MAQIAPFAPKSLLNFQVFAKPLQMFFHCDRMFDTKLQWLRRSVIAACCTHCIDITVSNVIMSQCITVHIVSGVHLWAFSYLSIKS